MESRWIYWLNEPISVSNSYVPRKAAIADFCKEGLFPLVKARGYEFKENDVKIIKLILKILFFISEDIKVSPVAQNKETPHFSDHYLHYCSVLDTMTWMNFWRKWGHIQDFQEDEFGYKFQFQLPEFIWSWIDLKQSTAVSKLDEDIEYLEGDGDGSKGKDDLYLQETSRRDYQDRHWF
jgi:hypothetical protein